MCVCTCTFFTFGYLIYAQPTQNYSKFRQVCMYSHTHEALTSYICVCL